MGKATKKKWLYCTTFYIDLLCDPSEESPFQSLPPLYMVFKAVYAVYARTNEKFIGIQLRVLVGCFPLFKRIFLVSSSIVTSRENPTKRAPRSGSTQQRQRQRQRGQRLGTTSHAKDAKPILVGAQSLPVAEPHDQDVLGPRTIGGFPSLYSTTRGNLSIEVL